MTVGGAADSMKEKTMRTISILGSGWLGLPLAKSLVNEGHEVNCSSRNEKKFDQIKGTGAKPFIVDLDTEEGYNDFLKSEILICGITSKNVLGFKKLIAGLNPSKISKVIFISSSSVYPFSNQEVTEESETKDTPLRQIEKLFQKSTDFETTILRFSGLIGDMRNPGAFFRGGKTCKHPDGYVNMIHLDDCIGLINSIIDNEIWGEILNGCADTHPTKRAFYDHYSSLLNRPSPNYEIVNPMVTKRVTSPKTRKLTGYKFKYPDVMKLPKMESQI